MRLEDLVPGVSIAGLLPGVEVILVHAGMHGTQACTLVYRTPDGGFGERVIYRPDLVGLSIGSGTTIGMGSIVLHNVPENCTAMGYPARVVKVS